MKKQKQIDELKKQLERMQERIDQLEASRWVFPIMVLPQPYPVPYPYPAPYVPTPSCPIITISDGTTWPTVTGTSSTWEVTPDSHTMIYGDMSIVSGMYTDLEM